MAKKENEVITIPISVWESAENKEDLEDWLFAHNPEFANRMRKAQKEAEEGKTVPLASLIEGR